MKFAVLSGGADVPSSVTDTIFGSAEKLFDLGLSIFDKVCANPILAVFIAAGVITVVLGVLKKTRKSVK